MYHLLLLLPSIQRYSRGFLLLISVFLHSTLICFAFQFSQHFCNYFPVIHSITRLPSTSSFTDLLLLDSYLNVEGRKPCSEVPVNGRAGPSTHHLLALIAQGHNSPHGLLNLRESFILMIKVNICCSKCCQPSNFLS